MMRSTHTTFLFDLLVSPAYRWLRYVIILIFLSFISFYQTYNTFEKSLEQIGDGLYLLSLYILFTYVFLFFFNIYVLIPTLFLKKKYIKYAVVLSATSLLVLILHLTMERVVYMAGHFGSPAVSYTTFTGILDFASSFLIVMMCILGGSMPVLLKQWILESQQVSKLENIQLQSEMELLKEQINPELLFNILNRAGTIADKEPEKASEMLIKLSQLLRYQLYDCNQEWVLLGAEINFLNNYLTLERLHSARFTYDIVTEGSVNGILTPPLLFIPFVEQAVQQLYRQEGCCHIQIGFKAGNNMIKFICSFCKDSPPTEENYTLIRQRLDMVYKDKYTLFIKGEPDNFIELHLDLSHHEQY